MRKLSLSIIFALTGFFVMGQAEGPAETNQPKIEALKVAFISKELALTPEEAQRFWPVYNQYSKEFNVSLREEKDVLVREEKTLNLKKKYKDQFTNMLGPERTNRMFTAEVKFRQLLLKSMRNQQQRNRANRPLQRRNN